MARTGLRGQQAPRKIDAAKKLLSRTLLNDQVLDRPRPVGGRDGGPGEMWRIFVYRESAGQCLKAGYGTLQASCLGGWTPAWTKGCGNERCRRIEDAQQRLTSVYFPGTM